MAAVAREQVRDLIEGLPSESLQELVRFIELLRFRGGQEAKAPVVEGELLGYVDRVEQEDAERAQALLELSRLRKIPLAALLTDFGLVSDA